MKSLKGGLHATAAAVNVANILSSSFSNVRQTGLILLINNGYNEDIDSKTDKFSQENSTGTGEIRLSLDGELFIDGKKVDPEKPIPGYKIFMDTKKSTSHQLNNQQKR